MRRYVVLGFLAVTLFANPCRAQSIDQSFVSGGEGLAALINECCKFIAQTYTAGRTGTLAGITIDVVLDQSTVYPLEVEIQSVSGGVPTGIILGQAMIAAGTSTLSSLITFSTIIPQVAGTQYAIVVDYPTAPSAGAGQGVGAWSGGTGNLYSGGEALIFLDNSWLSSCFGCDTHFQTFVYGPPPTITAIDPTSVRRGSVVTATLTGTNFIAGSTMVTLSGSGVTASTANVSSGTILSTVLTIDADASLGPRDIAVTTPNGASNTLVLTIFEARQRPSGQITSQ